MFTQLSDEAPVGVQLKIVCCKAAAPGLKAADGFVDVVVAIPMRVVGTVRANAVNIGDVAHVVLDEADELFAGDFVEQVDGVLAACESQRKDWARVHMFSATLPPAVGMLGKGCCASRRRSWWIARCN